MTPRIRNILLDRDGTIIEERHYLSDPEAVALIPGAGEALGRLTRAGIRLFCVTNQSGIGRGYYGIEEFQAVQQRLLSLLPPFGASIADTVLCPHAPDMACGCRKPAVGLFAQLAARHGLDPAETAVIGDAASDIGLGLAIGSPLTILVTTGHGRRTCQEFEVPDFSGPTLTLSPDVPGRPHVVARDLAAAAAYILGLTPETESGAS